MMECWFQTADTGMFFASRTLEVLLRYLRVSTVTATIALASSSLVLAERPPLPEDELIKGSDLIVEADVLSVTKTGQRDAPVWLARLNIRQTLKGAPPSNPLEYWFLPPEPSLAGGRNEAVFAGQNLRLYLIRDNSVYFEPWASNSIELLENFDEERYVLPTRLGEVIYADGKLRLPNPLRQSSAFYNCSSKIDGFQVTPHSCQSTLRTSSETRLHRSGSRCSYSSRILSVSHGQAR